MGSCCGKTTQTADSPVGMDYRRTADNPTGGGSVGRRHRSQQADRQHAPPPQHNSRSHAKENQGNGSPSAKRPREGSRSRQPVHETWRTQPSPSPPARGDSRSRQPVHQTGPGLPSLSPSRLLTDREQEPQYRLQVGVSHLPAERTRREQEVEYYIQRLQEMEAQKTRLAQDIKSYERRLQEMEAKLQPANKGQSDKRRLQEMERKIDELQRDLKKSQQDYMNLRDSYEEERKRHEREIQSERKRSQDAIEAEKIRSAQEAQSYKLSLREEMKVERTRLAKDTMSENRRLQEQIEGLKEENKILKSKNQDLLQRISSMASDRMRSNNPCVEDLSDPHRHSAVLGKWQALMNGEYWTLYEVALKQLPDEKNTAHFLLRIMELGFKEAQYLQNGSKAFMDLMQNQRTAQRDPSIATLIDSLMKNESFQQIVDSESRKVRKGSNATLSPADFQNFHTKILRESGNARRELLDRSHKFADEVLRLCFLMALQSPPMALVFDRPEDKEMDALLYEPDGDRNRRRPWIVKFVLTPPLLRHEGGPVLCKGTVEIS